MNMKPHSNVERLAAVRDKLKKTDMTVGGSGFWSPPVGKSIIRILPEIGRMKWFYQPVGKHSMSPDGKKNVYCPEFTSEGELPCPICELVDDLRQAGDAASKKLAGQLARKRAFWMNVIVRGNEAKGPQIFTPGVGIMNDLAGIIEDPDFGLIYDVDEGFDIKIERTGKGLDTEYQIRASRNPSPLSEDPKEAETWLSKARDLSWVELTNDPEEDKDIAAGHVVWVLPYDRIVKEFDLDNVGEDEDDEEELVTRKSMKSSPKKSAFVEEDDDEDEEDEDEDEDEDIPPAKQEVTRRRMARKSIRRGR